MAEDHRRDWKILLVDNDEDDYVLTRLKLSQIQGRNVSLEWAKTNQEGEQCIHTGQYDAILVDYDLGSANGIDLIRQAVSQGCRAPVILYTGQGSFEADIQAMQSGAAFYLTKGEANPLLFERAIRYAIERRQSEEALRLANEKLLALNQALHESRKELRVILESINDGFFAFDREWRYTYINHRAAQPLGYQPEELIGKNLWELFPKMRGTIAEEHYRKAMDEGEPSQYRVKGVYSGRWYDINVYPSADGISVFFIDRTEQVEAEQALRENAERLKHSNQALEDFAFIASHDLHEPLRKIEAFGQILKTHYSQRLGKEGRSLIERMQMASKRMQSMLDGLLAYSRVSGQDQRFTRVDLQKIAAEVLTDLEVRISQTRAQIEVGEMPVVEADPVQMRQLLQNLVGNALKFHRPGVPPQIRVYHQPVSPQTIRIIVEDNGIGFDPEYADTIFELFKRLQGRDEYEGTGAGLAICRKIVERHGGLITAASTPGEGSAFTIEIPIRQEDK